MGLNTTVLILNDALDQIEKDPEFGRRLAASIRESYTMKSTDRRRRFTANVPAGNHANAATVINTHHADLISLIAVGGNTAAELYLTSRHEYQQPLTRNESKWKLLEDALQASTEAKR